jgi:hypothetical protein
MPAAGCFAPVAVDRRLSRVPQERRHDIVHHSVEPAFGPWLHVQPLFVAGAHNGELERRLVGAVSTGQLPIVRVPDCRRLWFDHRDLDRAIEAWKAHATS